MAHAGRVWERSQATGAEKEAKKMTLGVTDGHADAERQWIRKHPEQKPWEAGRCLTGKKLPMEMAKKTTKEERKIGHKTPTSNQYLGGSCRGG